MIINDILDLSKVEADRLTLEFTEVKPDGLLAEVVSLLQLKAKKKGLHFTFVAEKSTPSVLVADPTRLRQTATPRPRDCAPLDLESRSSRSPPTR